MSKTPKPRIMFVLKFREFDHGHHRRHHPDHGYDCDDRPSSGLYNSAWFVYDMLLHAGVECRFVQVTDNNDIDREVDLYRPTHVIIEALWVIPEKFHVLRKLHPEVTWIARVHSELPFLG